MVHVKKLIYYKNIAFVIITILFIISLIYTSNLKYHAIKHKDYTLYEYARIDSINDIGRVVDINGNTAHSKTWQPYFTTKYTRPIHNNIGNSTKFHFFFYDVNHKYLFTLTDLGNGLISLSKLDLDYVKEYDIKKHRNIWQAQTK